MSWRTVVVTKPSKLDFTMGQMTVRDVENTVKISYYINILFITSSKPEHFSEFEELDIIDSDLCVIDTFENQGYNILYLVNYPVH